MLAAGLILILTVFLLQVAGQRGNQRPPQQFNNRPPQNGPPPRNSGIFNRPGQGLSNDSPFNRPQQTSNNGQGNVGRPGQNQNGQGQFQGGPGRGNQNQQPPRQQPPPPPNQPLPIFTDSFWGSVQLEIS